MKKLPLLITLLLVVLVAGGYFAYDRFLNKTLVSAWDLVPVETVLVYESSNCNECTASLKGIPISEIIQRAAFNSRNLDSLEIIRDFALSFQQPTLVSLHATQKENFDFVFYLPYNKDLQLQSELVFDKIYKSKGVKKSIREFNGIQIQEVLYNKIIFSWIVIDNNWVGSFSPILIEDVIRTYTTKDKTFKQSLSSVYQLPTIKKDGGNVYVHMENFATWFSLFTNEKPNSLIKQFGQSALLDLKVNEDSKLVLNGFSVEGPSKNFVLSAFKDQTPIPFQLKQFVSNRSLMLISYGISSGAEFNERLKNMKSHAGDSLAILSKSLTVDFAKLFASFSGEIGISWLEERNETVSKVVIVNNNTKEGITEWVKAFNVLSNKLSVDTVFHEVYSDYQIMEVPVFRFPEKLLGPLVSGFDHTYYASSGNVLYMAEDIQVLKKFLDDLNREDTWGKSVNKNTFLESTLLEANVSVFINTPLVWNVINKHLHPRWQGFIQENQTLTNALGMGALQFSHLNDSYYTNLSWTLKKDGASQPKAPNDRFIVNFENLITRFEIVKNHTDRSDEILIQDSTKIISLVSDEGKVLWKVALDDYIIGDVHQIDFLKNGKLQYFFATQGKLHLIDRLGNYVKPYPLVIPENEINFVSVIDYDRTRNYRFMITSIKGNLWMYDKEGNNLEGWQPKTIDGKVLTAPLHHRISGRDYIFAMRSDGLVYLMNRRGENIKNFPLNLEARLNGEYFVEPGKTPASTIITVVGRDGFRIKFNLEGKIQSKEVLVKNALDAKFSLVVEKNMESYLIVRQEAKQLTIMDDQLNELIASDAIGNNPVTIHYQNFGNGKNYIHLTDKSQDLSFVYTSKGQLLTTLPIDSYDLRVKPNIKGEEKLYFYNGGNLTIGNLKP